jgi:hypothetical protein
MKKSKLKDLINEGLNYCDYMYEYTLNAINNRGQRFAHCSAPNPSSHCYIYLNDEHSLTIFIFYNDDGDKNIYISLHFKRAELIEVTFTNNEMSGANYNYKKKDLTNLEIAKIASKEMLLKDSVKTLIDSLDYDMIKKAKR